MNVFRMDQVTVDAQSVKCREDLDYIFVPVDAKESFPDAIRKYMAAELGKTEVGNITFSNATYVGKAV